MNNNIIVSCAILLLHWFCFSFSSGNSTYSFIVKPTYDISHCKEILHGNHQKRYRSRGNIAETRLRSGDITAESVPVPELLRYVRPMLSPLPRYFCGYRNITVVPIPMQPSVGSSFHRQGAACRKEDRVGGRARVTVDEERVQCTSLSCHF